MKERERKRERKREEERERETERERERGRGRICVIKKRTPSLKVRGWKKIFHASGNEKRTGVAILISDKIDFKIKTITRDKEGHYMMIKGSIQEEGITIVNIYAPRSEEHTSELQSLTTISYAVFCLKKKIKYKKRTRRS